MAHVIPLWSPPALPVAGGGDAFPVRRIFCVGRNYAEHQKEMGGSGREQPFFFIKSAHALVPGGGDVHYPPKTSNYHYETELVVALGKGGRRIAAGRADEHVYGYAVGLDMTRRDLQQWGKDHGRPWDFGKDFDEAAPCSALVPAAKIGHPAPLARGPLYAAGTSALPGAASTKSWPNSHGRPWPLPQCCRSRRVMSSPTA
jgi:fumarylpyruvate hydrolase